MLLRTAALVIISNQFVIISHLLVTFLRLLALQQDFIETSKKYYVQSYIIMSICVTKATTKG